MTSRKCLVLIIHSFVHSESEHILDIRHWASLVIMIAVVSVPVGQNV